MERINAWTPLYVAIDRLCSKPYDDFCGSELKPVELTFFVISLIDKLRSMPWNNGVSPQVSRTVGDLRMLMEYELKGLSKKQVQGELHRVLAATIYVLQVGQCEKCRKWVQVLMFEMKKIPCNSRMFEHLLEQMERQAEELVDWAQQYVNEDNGSYLSVQLKSYMPHCLFRFCFGEFVVTLPPVEPVAIKAESVAIKAESVAIKAESVAIKAESVAIKAESVAIKAESVAIKAEPGQMKSSHTTNVSFYGPVNQVINF